MEPISPYPPTRIRVPAMRQAWCDLTFLHWRCDPRTIRPQVPAALELDVYDGAAWLGLIPFDIRGIGWSPSFLEANVRTYVVDRKGRRGVWFFSLDAASLPAVIGARAGYALPYFLARMKLQRDGTKVHYFSRRMGSGRECDLQIDVGERIAAPSELEHFLTARFRLYSRLFRAEIEHPPWPLQRARVIRLKQDLVRAPDTEPLAHFAQRVEVAIGLPIPRL
jgi:uncharacterized protein